MASKATWDWLEVGCICRILTCGSRVAADPSKLAGDLVYSGRSLITPTFFFIPLFGSTQNNCSTAVNCPPSAAVTVQPPTECMIFGFFFVELGSALGSIPIWYNKTPFWSKVQPVGI